MTQNRRIIFNTIATYGRSMFGVLCGIFSTRWVLQALGHEDYGLYAVVGSMAIFIGFLNVQFGGAISRYYAFAVGQARTKGDSEEALLECRSWFSTAVLIHTLLPFLIVAIGWPVGEYAITHQWLEISNGRVEACVWVWRIVCAETFVGMFNVPYQAMYIAKQYIAELTVYSFLQTLVRTMFIYYMTLKPCDWLVKYAAGIAVITVLPQLAICLRAIVVFKECRIVKGALREFYRVRNLASYALWTALGGVGYVASHQCMSILINNFFGARFVAGFGIAQTVSGEAASLTGALQGAFAPAITTAYGAGELARFQSMSFWACKIGTLLTLLFAIPMALEIDQILVMWLKTPPPMAAPMCLCTLGFIVIEKLTCGHLSAVNATGDIAAFQIVRGLLRCLVIPMAIIPAYLGLGVVAATLALPISVVFVDLGDVLLSKSRVGFRVGYWVNSIVCPLSIISAVALCFGLLIRYVMPETIVRIATVTLMTGVVVIVGGWLFLLTSQERLFVMQKFHLNR